MLIIQGFSPDISESLVLINNIFNKFIAPDYSEEGCINFLKFANDLSKRVDINSVLYLAKDNDKIIGILEKRNDNHINLFFVDEKYQGKGIGRRLFQEAFTEANAVTVNSSPFALKIYEKLGFEVINEEQNVHGIRFIPMKLQK